MSAPVHTGIHPLGRHPLGRHPPLADTPLGQTTPAQCMLGYTPPCPVHAGIDMATAADVTHPTGMHSCYRLHGEGNVFTGVCLSTISFMATRPCYGAVGTHPTGMLSCCNIRLCVAVNVFITKIYFTWIIALH